jgi:hypothetical protein
MDLSSVFTGREASNFVCGRAKRGYLMAALKIHQGSRCWLMSVIMSSWSIVQHAGIFMRASA